MNIGNLVKLFSWLVLIIPLNLFSQTGQELYLQKTCNTCHGNKAEGNQLLGAPLLAGQEAKYLMRQLINFKTGARGYNIDDYRGKIMAAIAKSLAPAEISSLATYLNSVKPSAINYKLAGDPIKGKQLYATCAICHGEQGIGNPALNAPNLQIQHDWYIASQLTKFKNGTRGDAEYDIIGATMAPNAIGLADDKALNDISAYIYSLKYPAVTKK